MAVAAVIGLLAMAISWCLDPQPFPGRAVPLTTTHAQDRLVVALLAIGAP
jgi:hypothetical protein